MGSLCGDKEGMARTILVLLFIAVLFGFGESARRCPDPRYHWWYKKVICEEKGRVFTISRIGRSRNFEAEITCGYDGTGSRFTDEALDGMECRTRTFHGSPETIRSLMEAEFFADRPDGRSYGNFAPVLQMMMPWFS